MRLFLLTAIVTLASSSSAPANFSRTYADGTKLNIVLIGEDADIVRVTSIPANMPATFHRYQGYIRSAVQSQTSGFVEKDGPDEIELSTAKLTLSVSKTSSRTGLKISGVLVSDEVAPISRQHDASCVPQGWKSVAAGQAETLSGNRPDSCLRQVRSLRSGEEIYGFGQMPQEGLSTVGEAKLLATFR